MQAGKYKGEIIIRDDGDKDKDVKSRNKEKSKDRDNKRKSSSREDKIIDKNDKKKCKNRVACTKSCDKVWNRDQNNINTELNRKDICDKFLSRSGASNGDMGSKK